MADKVQVHDSLAKLEFDGKPEPYRLGLAGGHITFPDPAEMQWDLAEDFLEDLASSRSIEDVFSRWLSEADWQKLKDAKPTFGQLRILAGRLQQHYSYILGDQGEGLASGTY